jgi:hypothetical protein
MACLGHLDTPHAINSNYNNDYNRYYCGCSYGEYSNAAHYEYERAEGNKRSNGVPSEDKNNSEGKTEEKEHQTSTQRGAASAVNNAYLVSKNVIAIID